MQNVSFINTPNKQKISSKLPNYQANCKIKYTNQKTIEKSTKNISKILILIWFA